MAFLGKCSAVIFSGSFWYCFTECISSLPCPTIMSMYLFLNLLLIKQPTVSHYIFVAYFKIFYLLFFLHPDAVTSNCLWLCIQQLTIISHGHFTICKMANSSGSLKLAFRNPLSELSDFWRKTYEILP